MNQEFDLRKSVRRTNSVSFHGIFFGDFARLPSGQANHSKRLQLSFAISKSADSSNLRLYILFLENFFCEFFFSPYLFLEYILYIYILFTFREEKIFFTRFSLRRRKWRSRIFSFFLFLFLLTRRYAFDFSIIVEINEETKRLIGNRISRIDQRLLI